MDSHSPGKSCVGEISLFLIAFTNVNSAYQVDPFPVLTFCELRRRSIAGIEIVKKLIACRIGRPFAMAIRFVYWRRIAFRC